MSRRWILTIVVAAGAALWSGDAFAQPVDAEAPSCRPIMTCGAEDTATGLLGRRCPDGHTCVCVPSCPNCRDCAAQVCVPTEKRECRTACDCEPGLGCFDGKCIAGFAPVFCCDGEYCPAGEQCQHRDGAMDRCDRPCVDQAWLCDLDGERRCGDGRVCTCSSSCPECLDCGPNVCLPPDSGPAYRCNNDGSCARPGDQCICVSSCPECDDCALSLCVAGCGADPKCEERLRQSQRRMQRAIEKASVCRVDDECVHIDTSTGCQGSCGEYVNRRWARRVQNFINHLDARYCSGYQEAGCPYATPRCMATVGACVRGMCTGVPAPAVRPVPRTPIPERPADALRVR